MLNNDRRVVITGISSITPIGLTVEEFRTNLFNGVSGAALITKFDTSRVDTKFACEVKGFDPANYMDKKSARRMDLFCQYAMASSSVALQDAMINPEELSIEDREDMGVVFGSGIGGFNTFYEQATTNYTQGPSRISPFFIPMMIPDIASGQISIRYGLKGPNYCAVSACATANNNIIDAFMLIKQGMTNLMIAGGSEAPLCEIGIAGFNANKALSTRNDDPSRASRPFDKTRDGFVMGEGGGAMILEEYGHAIARGAKIYAEIVGVGLSADGYHLTAPDPAGTGAQLAMKRALKSASLKPEDVDYINMHGTSTGLGDIAESKAIKSVFGDHAYKLSVSSTKSMTGHLLGAAGAVEAIASILAMQEGKIPPTINFENPDEECDLDYTFNVAKERNVDIAISNAFGFGGHNTSIIFKKITQ